MGVGREDIAEAALARGRGQLVDEGGRGGEAGVEAVLDSAIGDPSRRTRSVAAG